MGMIKAFGLFCSIHQLDPDKPSSWDNFRRDELGLPWQIEETGIECPACGKGTVKKTGARWCCFYCGENGGTEEAPRTKTKKELAAERQYKEEKDAERRARALKVWNETEPITAKHATVHAYFAARCLTLSVLPDLDSVMRWHPRCPFKDEELGKTTLEPCVVSLFRDALSDEATGIHRTHIVSARDGESKKQAWGPITGSVIKLWPLNGSKALTAGEGIETVMAAVELGASIPAWAATTAYNLSCLPPIRGVRRLLTISDNDAHGKGQKNAAFLRRKWQALGKVTRNKKPERAKDFNEVLIAMRRGQP